MKNVGNVTITLCLRKKRHKNYIFTFLDFLFISAKNCAKMSVLSFSLSLEFKGFNVSLQWVSQSQGLDLIKEQNWDVILNK